MCGIVLAHSLHDAYNILKDLQHRGQEAVGIGGIKYDGTIDSIKWKGLVTAFSHNDLEVIFPGSDYVMFMGHNRYATIGRKDKILDDAHPHTIGGDYEKRLEHTWIEGSEAAIVHNGQVNNNRILEKIDKKLLKTDCDSEAFLQLYKKIGPEEILKTIPSAYSAIIVDKDRDDVLFLRDRYGVRPAWLGWKNGKYIIASEDTAIRKNGGKVIEEIRPGSIVKINRNGNIDKEYVLEPEPKHCFFEINYLMDYESTFCGINVMRARENLGRALAKEFSPDDMDYVTYVPHCPEFHARGYAKAIGKKFKDVFYKKQDIRSFMQSEQELRKKSIEENLYILPNVDVKDKVILVIDDSIVRGTVVERAVNVLKDAGAKKVYYLSGTPPIGEVIKGIGRGCYLGVDMPPSDKFAIRAYGSSEGVEKHSGADKVHYISTENMFNAIGLPPENCCYYCIGGWTPDY